MRLIRNIKLSSNNIGICCKMDRSRIGCSKVPDINNIGLMNETLNLIPNKIGFIMYHHKIQVTEIMKKWQKLSINKIKMTKIT